MYSLYVKLLTLAEKRFVAFIVYVPIFKCSFVRKNSNLQDGSSCSRISNNAFVS